MELVSIIHTKIVADQCDFPDCTDSKQKRTSPMCRVYLKYLKNHVQKQHWTLSKRTSRKPITLFDLWYDKGEGKIKHTLLVNFCMSMSNK